MCGWVGLYREEISTVQYFHRFPRILLSRQCIQHSKRSEAISQVTSVRFRQGFRYPIVGYLVASPVSALNLSHLDGKRDHRMQEYYVFSDVQ